MNQQQPKPGPELIAIAGPTSHCRRLMFSADAFVFAERALNGSDSNHQ
jgi:hypothetical protein